ncbi:histidine kinase dimerization/phospho-acceptor domain-containing protein [Nocardioides sp.]|uniref:histidine kinase dimerization/phospho-acceptor domain-containing protein n=1 Tax=Nocardioides sp. TaxID=35761 RepID=UPI00356744AA
MDTDLGFIRAVPDLVEDNAVSPPENPSGFVDEHRETMARVHHEIRTPLAALLAHIELLEVEADLELPYRVEISVAAIKRSGDRLRALMAELDESVGEPSPGLIARRNR